MQVVDWREAQPKQLARALERGAVLAFPAEGGMVSVSGKGSCVLLPGPAAVFDWAPGLGEAGRRIAERCWPGPLVLACSETEGGLGRRLGLDRFTMRLPAHPSLAAVARASRVPLLCEEGYAGADAVIHDPAWDAGAPAAVVEANGADWVVRRAGAMDVGERLARVVIFVCTGNTCRSPMAEAIFKTLLAARLGCAPEELGKRGWVIVSAGLAAMPGMPAAREAVQVAGELAKHASRPLTEELAMRADLLVCMTRGHAGALRGLPARLLCADGADVDDPIGQPLEAYRECARLMEAHLARLAEELTSPR